MCRFQTSVPKNRTWLWCFRRWGKRAGGRINVPWWGRIVSHSLNNMFRISFTDVNKKQFLIYRWYTPLLHIPGRFSHHTRPHILVSDTWQTPILNKWAFNFSSKEKAMILLNWTKIEAVFGNWSFDSTVGPCLPYFLTEKITRHKYHIWSS